MLELGGWVRRGGYKIRKTKSYSSYLPKTVRQRKISLNVKQIWAFIGLNICSLWEILGGSGGGRVCGSLEVLENDIFG